MQYRRYNHKIVFSILLIVWGMLFFGNNAYAKKICDYCKREITNSDYVWVGNNYFHNDHFFCNECKKSLVDKKFFKEKGKYYCEKCYDDKFVLKCNKCGDPINGPYFKIDGKIFHEECYDKFVAPKCNLCKKSIIGDYLTDSWGNKYHRYHEDSEPFCEYCHRFISEDVSGGGWVYDDGRTICGICKENSINDNREAEKLMVFISQKLEKFGIKVNPKKIKLELVDKGEISRLAHNRSKEFSGLTLFEGKKILGKTISNNFRVFILHGMPRENFLATMAHELMHVWLYSKAPIEMDPALTEGSCNYASYLLLQNDRSERVGFILKGMEDDTDIFYGEGYRRVKRMVRRNGIESWLEYLVDNKNFPSGY